MVTLAYGLLMGAAATWTMDTLGKGARKLGLKPGINGPWIGRWFAGLAAGQFSHPNIDATPPHPQEKRITPPIHYAIGMVLGVVYLVATGALGFSPENLIVALIYGFATNVFPWFLMFPAMGFGFLGLRCPPERNLLAASTAKHLFYGFGLWWTAMLLPV